MAGVKEARLALERESIVLPSSEATSARLIELTKGLFSKGYKDVELIGKVAEAQVCYIDLLDVDGATGYEDLAEDVKLNLVNDRCVVEDGVVCDSLTVQATNPKAWDKLSGWMKVDTDYFNLNDEEITPPPVQIQALIDAGKAIAESLNEPDKLEFILRPTELHDNLLKAIMEARGVEMRRVARNGDSA